MTHWQLVSPEEFDAAFSEDALVAEFADEAAEHAYVDRDTRLIKAIKGTCSLVAGTDADEHVHHLEDWWPNHTRYVYVSAKLCSNVLISALRALLVGEFTKYRIPVIANHDLTDDKDQEVGALVIYTDRAVVETRVANCCALTPDCMAT